MFLNVYKIGIFGINNLKVKCTFPTKCTKLSIGFDYQLFQFVLFNCTQMVMFLLCLKEKSWILFKCAKCGEEWYSPNGAGLVLPLPLQDMDGVGILRLGAAALVPVPDSVSFRPSSARGVHGVRALLAGRMAAGLVPGAGYASRSPRRWPVVPVSAPGWLEVDIVPRVGVGVAWVDGVGPAVQLSPARRWCRCCRCGCLDWAPPAEISAAKTPLRPVPDMKKQGKYGFKKSPKEIF